MATACLLGVPAQRLVYGDLVERLYWNAVTGRAAEMEVMRRENQAVANANAIGEMLRRLFRRRGSRAG